MLCQLRLPPFGVGFLERHKLAALRLTVVGNEVYGYFWTLFPLPEGVTVDNPERYLWQPAFSSAVLESDAARMLGTIYERLPPSNNDCLVPSKKTSAELLSRLNRRRGVECHSQEGDDHEHPQLS